MAFRRQQTSLRTVASYQRALDTMGKLAAQQAGTAPDRPVNPDSPYVRVVHADAAPPAPPRPPSVRSRPRRPHPTPPPTAVAAPGPNTRIVTTGEEPAQADPTDRPDPTDLTGRTERPVEPLDGWPGELDGAAGPPMLHFDATGDFSRLDGASSWAEVAPSQPDREARSRPRPARPRSRRRATIFRSSGPGLRRLGVGALAAAVLIVAGVVGFALAGSGGPHRHQPAPNPPVAAPRPAATPVASAQTTPTTSPPPTAILVASSTGSSTYRVGASATITVQAGTGTCWMEIRQSGPYGPVLFTGDLMAGQSRDMNGPVWVRLGNPGVIAVTVNGASLSPPGMIAGEPYDLQFA